LRDRRILLGVPILLGVIGRAHGVRGLVRVTSHTADPAALTGYGPLSDPSGRRFTLRWVGEGIAEIFEIVDGKKLKVGDRSAAERLTNTRLFIERDRLPPPEADEYYLADLIGLEAVRDDGRPLGVVSVVHDYGAGVSLEIAREGAGSLLVPFTEACVPVVDISGRRLTVVPPDEVDGAERQSVSNRHDPGPERHPVSERHPLPGRHPRARPEDQPGQARRPTCEDLRVVSDPRVKPEDDGMVERADEGMGGRADDGGRRTIASPAAYLEGHAARMGHRSHRAGTNDPPAGEAAA
jgi:16S rRNA processing protein RimM